MAQISERNYEHLRTVQANYIRLETLQETSNLKPDALSTDTHGVNHVLLV